MTVIVGAIVLKPQKDRSLFKIQTSTNHYFVKGILTTNVATPQRMFMQIELLQDKGDTEARFVK